MNAERMPWQPGRAMLGEEVTQLAAYLAERNHSEIMGSGIVGGLALRKARGMEQIAALVVDKVINKLIESANGCTGG